MTEKNKTVRREFLQKGLSLGLIAGGACGEVCPTHAIRFIDKQNILYPKVDVEYCIGSGACQLVCPTTPKAIVVTANQIHQTAVKYDHLAKPAPLKQKLVEDFPF